MKKTFFYTAILIFSGGLLGAALTGCGESLFEGLADDNTDAAKIEKAKMAMDDGDYAEVAALLKPFVNSFLDPDLDGDFDNNGDLIVDANDFDLTGMTAEQVDLATDFATAYLGLSGVDLIEFLNASAEIAKLSLKDRIRLAASRSLQQGIDFWVSPAYAATDCLNDPDFKVVSDALPTLDADNLDDLELGIAILDALKDYIETNLDLDIDSSDQKNLELLRATGYFTRLVMDIILATDANANNIPDPAPAIPNITDIDATIAQRVDDGFDIALDAISQSGILGTVGSTDFDEQELAEAINDLKNDIDAFGNPDGTISEAELEAYLTELVLDCTET